MPQPPIPVSLEKPNPYHVRIPFALAIRDPKTFAPIWKKLSRPQQVALKIFYGLPLDGEEEMKLWAAYQGFGEFDELGYLTGVTYVPPYVPKEYEILSGLIGRRSGKSDRIGGVAAAYEITLGGHSAYINTGQPAYWLYIAQDLDTAKLNLKFVLNWIKESPTLAKMIEHETDEEIEFKNGIILKAEPPTIRLGRGAAVIGVTMDEVAFWYKNAKSANPDFEVIRAVEQSMLQFPHAKQLRITTPWTKEGVAYIGYRRGTEGHRVSCQACLQAGPVQQYLCPHVPEDRLDDEGQVVLTAPTAMMGNPLVTRRRLLRLWRKDKEAFRRESLAQFIDSQTSFLTHASIEAAIEVGVTVRPPIPGVTYIAAIDPAFRQDSFAFTIGHLDSQLGVVQDYVYEWIPEPGERLDPKQVLLEIKAVTERYGIDLIYSDQGQYEALASLGEELGMTIYGVDFTVKSKPKMMNNLASQLNQRKIRLLQHENQEKQLKKLQKIVGPSKYVSVAAPPGEHDDLAMVLALMISQALLMPAHESGAAGAGEKPRNPFIPAADLEKIRARHQLLGMYDEAISEQNARWALLEAYE